MKATKTYMDCYGDITSESIELTLSANKVTRLKPSNLSKVMAFISNDMTGCVQGSQLEALYKLIQKHGNTIQGGNELNNLKCILLSNGQYLAMVHRPVGVNFFPCMTRCYLLSEVKSASVFFDSNDARRTFDYTDIESLLETIHSYKAEHYPMEEDAKVTLYDGRYFWLNTYISHCCFDEGRVTPSEYAEIVLDILV